ncbi:MAG: hypothetical protein U0L51_06485 [Olegusella sp.]|nr:hypothetical protein [Olegusella sp.]
MALIDIQRVEVGPRTLTARVRLAEGAPLMTSDDIEGTARVYYLLPHIVEHVCLGDSAEKFRDVMGDTEVAHLLEHVTVELLALTNIAGDVSTGRTFAVEGDDRAWDIELACPDDVLVSAALASGAWLLDWAYNGGGDPEPDIGATIAGLVDLIDALPAPEPQQVGEGEVIVDEFTPVQEDEALEFEPAAEPEPVEEAVPSEEPESDAEPMGADEPEAPVEPAPEPEATDAEAMPEEDVVPAEEEPTPEAEVEADEQAAEEPVEEPDIEEPEDYPAPHAIR